MRAPTGSSRIALAVAALPLLACSDPTSSPGGAATARPILFIGRTFSGVPGGDIGEPVVYSVRGDGSGLRPLTSGAAQGLYPAWSRDGSRFAFASGDQGTQVWLADADGSDAHPIAGSPPCFYSFTRITWEASGQRVAAECNANTYVIDLGTGDSYSLTTRLMRSVVHPDWAPDGRMIFVGADLFPSDAFVASADGSDTSVTRVLSNVLDPAWSPDGRRVAFAAGADSRLSIYVADADGTHRRLVTTLPASADADEAPAWSPDGQWIAFHRRAPRCVDAGSPPTRTCSPHWSIYVVRADGRDVRRLTPDDLQATRPSW